MGYFRAGFDVTGVDITPQPYYPFRFILGDAMEVELLGWDVIAASPPCQRYSVATPSHRRDGHPDLLSATRERVGLLGGVPYIIENVPGAPMINPVTVCGETLRTGVRRHRLFESNIGGLLGTPCFHDLDQPVPVYGSYGQTRGHHVDEARAAMGIDWLPWPALTQAVPPMYTYHLGLQLMARLTGDACDLDDDHGVTVQPRSVHNVHYVSAGGDASRTKIIDQGAMVTRRCPRDGCGKPLVRPPTGRWPHWCSHACRQAGYRQRLDAA